MLSDNFWGDQIRLLRTDACMSQRRLAEVTGAGRGTINRFESGLGSIDVRSLERILDFFGYELEAIKMDPERPLEQPDPDNARISRSRIWLMGMPEPE